MVSDRNICLVHCIHCKFPVVWDLWLLNVIQNFLPVNKHVSRSIWSTKHALKCSRVDWWNYTIVKVEPSLYKVWTWVRNRKITFFKVQIGTGFFILLFLFLFSNFFLFFLWFFVCFFDRNCILRYSFCLLKILWWICLVFCRKFNIPVPIF